MKIKILIPVYNDWQSLSQLLEVINNLSISPEFKISVIIVNDASNHDRQDENKILNNIESIKILNNKFSDLFILSPTIGLSFVFLFFILSKK